MNKTLLSSALIVAGLALIAYGILPNSGSFDESEWYSLGKALELAKKENKMVFVFVSSDTCVYCEKMKVEVFSDKQLMDKLKSKYIPALVNAEKDVEDVRRIAKLFGGDFGYPAFVIFSPDGVPVNGWSGFVTKEELEKILDI
ncbi:thioredoxin fold domain-containing protein [Geoglobus acetivorans]|uniref:Thioredoxin family protein n=1 Tax=Geoglobus acetivorans TaxID=565033 RepID=A0ABZ3GZ91_GEOAI|nr:thioredoxin family protein [Geoglobus acetivorans]